MPPKGKERERKCSPSLKGKWKRDDKGREKNLGITI